MRATILLLKEKDEKEEEEEEVKLLNATTQYPNSGRKAVNLEQVSIGSRSV